MERNVIIDVRERDEFAAEHIVGSINVPLTEFDRLAPSKIGALEDQPITLMCRSGKRAELAASRLAQLGVTPKELAIYEGGIIAWCEPGPRPKVSSWCSKASPIGPRQKD